MKNNMLGICGIQTKVFDDVDYDYGIAKLNNFLKEHNGNIIDVQPIYSTRKGCILVTYKEVNKEELSKSIIE